jgi:hypothetical protein
MLATFRRFFGLGAKEESVYKPMTVCPFKKGDKVRFFYNGVAIEGLFDYAVQPSKKICRVIVEGDRDYFVQVNKLGMAFT